MTTLQEQAEVSDFPAGSYLARLQIKTNRLVAADQAKRQPLIERAGTLHTQAEQAQARSASATAAAVRATVDGQVVDWLALASVRIEAEVLKAAAELADREIPQQDPRIAALVGEWEKQTGRLRTARALLAQLEDISDPATRQLRFGEREQLLAEQHAIIDQLTAPTDGTPHSPAHAGNEDIWI